MGIMQMIAAAGGLDEFLVAKSLRFNDDDTAYLNWTPSGDGSTATWTLSFWFKRGNLPGSNQYLVAAKDGSNYFELLLNSSDKLAIYNYQSSGAALSATDRVFRDCSAFYHIVYTYDTSQSGDDKLKLYVNGTQETSFSTDNRSSTGASYWNTATVHTIGSSTTPHNHFDGYLADLHFVDGSALDASSFGETVDGSWVPKEFSDSHGTNGYYLKFNNTSDLGEDSAGSNDWTANNFSTSAGAGNDVLADSPHAYDDGGNGVGNYCTLNPLDKYSGLTLSNGNLNLDHSSGGTIPCCRSTIGMSSGKWYFEVTRGSGTYGTMGICTAATSLSEYAGRSSNAVGGYEIYTENNKKWAGGSGGTSGYLTENWNSDGDVASCYFDADNGTIGFMVNGTDMGTAYSGIDTTKTYFFQCGSQGTELDANFGQRAFAYTPPTGYLALNSYNT